MSDKHQERKFRPYDATQKHEGWVNIYKPLYNGNDDNRYAAWLRSPDVYKTKEEAIEMAKDTVWATVKIE